MHYGQFRGFGGSRDQSRDGGEEVQLVALIENSLPLDRVEYHQIRGEKLLQRPVPREPLAVAYLLGKVRQGLGRGDIGEICETDLRVGIPSVHGIYGLGQLGARRLVDAARINPYSPAVVVQREMACTDNLGVTLQVPDLAVVSLDLLEAYLVVTQVCERIA